MCNQLAPLPTIWLESDDSDDPCSDKGAPKGHLKREIEHEIQLLKDLLKW